MLAAHEQPSEDNGFNLLRSEHPAFGGKIRAIGVNMTNRLDDNLTDKRASINQPDIVTELIRNHHGYQSKINVGC